MTREEMRAELLTAFNEINQRELEVAAQAHITQAVDELVAVGQNRGPPVSEECKAWLTRSSRQVGRKRSEAKLDATAQAALRLAAALEAMHKPALNALFEVIATSEWRNFIARGGIPVPMRLMTAEEAPPRPLEIGLRGARALRALVEQARTAKGYSAMFCPSAGAPPATRRTTSLDW